MSKDTTKEVVDFIKSRVAGPDALDGLLDIIVALEWEYPVRISLVTKGDVESEFEEAWLFDGAEERQMTEEEWEKFRSEWFWRKGHSDIMWDGVTDAIRWDLREAGLLPKDAVV
jgi:hypothetical protein